MLWVVLSVLYSLDPRDCYTDLPKLVEKCIGETIIITPDFVGYPTTPVLDWTNIPGDGRHKVHQNGTLVIKNAQVEDSDMYSYLVHSEDEFTLALFNLSVTDCGNMIEPTSPTSVIKTSTTSSTRDGVSVTPTDRVYSITPTAGDTVTPATGDIITVTPTTKELPLTTRLTAETDRLPTTSKTLVPATISLPSSSPLETPVLVTSKNLPTSTPLETPVLVTSGDVTSEVPDTTSGREFSSMTEDLPSSSTYRVVSSPPSDGTISEATVTKPFVSSSTPGGGVDNLSGNSEFLCAP